MNLKGLHSDKEVSAKPLSDSVSANATSIQILKNGILTEHISKIPALLICVTGEVEYQDENKTSVNLGPGDYFEIEPMVKHRVKANQDSQLVLIR